MILHITTINDWNKAKLSGEYAANSLQSEGFIHCSTIKQAAETANLFFKGQKSLVLLCIDESRLKPELKFEDPSGGGQHDPNLGKLFPHIYGPINLSAVIKVIDFPADNNGVFELPKGLAVQTN